MFDSKLQEPAAEVAAGGVPATQSLTDAGFPTEGEGGDIDGGKVGEGPGVAEGRGVVIPGFPTEETNGGTGGSVVEAGFPTEEEAGGIERADGAGARGPGVGRLSVAWTFCWARVRENAH